MPQCSKCEKDAIGSSGLCLEHLIEAISPILYPDSPGGAIGDDIDTGVSNDRISQTLKDFVPDELQGNSKFLDIITWNIRFFNDRDPERVEIIRSIFEELNADIFVLQEISEGSLDGIARDLAASGAGFYKTVYGKSGGDIRVAFMYDTDWVKAKMEPEELFTDDPKVRVGNETKSVFPRRPLHSTFVARSVPDSGSLHDPFDFHLVGVHLKSQRDSRQGHCGEEQRTAAARHLADWIKFHTTDEDVIIAGDWNASPLQPEWEVFRELETAGKIRFANWNPEKEGSHFVKSGESTRVDCIAVTNTVDGIEEIQNEAKVINWNVLLEGGNMTQSLRSDLIEKVSDHLPVLTRFYFTDIDSSPDHELEEIQP